MTVRLSLCIAVTVAMTVTALVRPGAAAGAQPVLWQDPGDVGGKDLRYGAGGFESRPIGPFRFIKEETGGTNPKIRVRDRNGRVWIVKFGPEVKADVFGARLAWAVGYYTQPSYFVRSGAVTGARKLGRASEFVTQRGRFGNARFKLIDPAAKPLPGNGWRWDRNPFLNTPQLNGLKLILLLTSNWDAKDARDDESNTMILRRVSAGRAQHVYSFDDWGSSMGKWGNFFTREKWGCADYREQNDEFIRGLQYGRVGFGYSGKHADDLAEGIRKSDVRWLMRYLGRLSDRQLTSALVASGASSAEARCFARALQTRIRALDRVAR